MTHENPFRFGKIATEDRFCNRTNEISDLVQYLSSGKNAWLFSPRRFGKTSLVQLVLGKLASRKKMKTVFLDIFDTQNEKMFALAFATAVANALSDKIDRAFELAKTVFLFLAPKVVLGENGSPELQFGIQTRSAPETILDDVMRSIAEVIEKKEISLVIAIDEFQQILEYEDTHLFQAKLRKYIQNQQTISYVFLGSQRHLMQEIFTSKKKPFFQSAVPIELGLIPKDELIESFLRLTKNTDVPFSRELSTGIVNLTNGHPYHSEKLASFCFDLSPSHGEILSVDKFLHEVIVQIVEREESIYKNFLKLLTPGQRSVLVAVAKYSGKVPSNDMVRTYSLSSRQYLDKTIDFLIRKELVDDTDGGICIYDICFKHWLRNMTD